MKTRCIFAALLTAVLAGQVQASDIAKPSVYAVNAAALASAMTYCATKHGNINKNSPGAECFAKARNLLGELKLDAWAQGIDGKCTDQATYNKCMTPEIGRLVYSLNDAFNSRSL